MPPYRSAGHDSYEFANLQYGKLGARLREALGAAGRVPGQRSAILASFVEPDETHRYWRWVMRPELAVALNELGWFWETGPVGETAETRESAAQEGMVRLRLVRHRHREEALRQAKIEEARTQNPRGRLICEVPGCGFDFEAQYGELGRLFAEVHHLGITHK